MTVRSATVEALTTETSPTVADPTCSTERSHEGKISGQAAEEAASGVRVDVDPRTVAEPAVLGHRSSTSASISIAKFIGSPATPIADRA